MIINAKSINEPFELITYVCVRERGQKGKVGRQRLLGQKKRGIMKECT